MKEDSRGDVRRLADIQVSIRKIIMATSDGEDAFRASFVIQDATVRNLEVMGEAAGRVSEAVRSQHPEIPWKRMRGLASFAKHEYWNIDLDQLWRTVEQMPALEAKVSSVRADHSDVRSGKKSDARLRA